ncbi:MAG TPA: phospho-N-acetylmuramoyl-pentapeptide-transferase [Candidatus Moranbacteria bacterium]|nr:phospho-N-acetylmuramoyl-pentapeptide-transferase [Candidatus Moranbacteria bacterium]HRZ33304.1 phospho-N-acetylmuramoyl-pentapeptide-transferase [Candidatus Moranbacteria bacterium]
MEFAQIQTIPEAINVLKIFATGLIACILTFLITPLWTHILYKYKIGIKIKSTDVNGEKLNFINKLHAEKAGTPTMGGAVIWIAILILVFSSHYIFPWIAKYLNINFIARLDFLSRSQVWLPLFALTAAGVLGFFDDIMSVRGWGKNKGGGMRFIMRFGWLLVIAAYGSWWFFYKLGWDTIHIPAVGDFSIGFWYIPLFIFVILFSAISSNETDGLDGLNGGVLLMAFFSFAIIAFMQNKVNLASFCAALAGSILAFLWFNIYPARFFMGDTGAVSLGATLGVVAMLTNSVLVLFVIAFFYILESGSVTIQLLSKKFFHKKVFLAAPIHHHFEAKGWPEAKITMRAWIFTMITALLGVLIAIFGMGKIH